MKAAQELVQHANKGEKKAEIFELLRAENIMLLKLLVTLIQGCAHDALAQEYALWSKPSHTLKQEARHQVPLPEVRNPESTGRFRLVVRFDCTLCPSH